MELWKILRIMDEKETSDPTPFGGYISTTSEQTLAVGSIRPHTWGNHLRRAVIRGR